jgi:thiol-disulfide isomerase/thioredoxin
MVEGRMRRRSPLFVALTLLVTGCACAHSGAPAEPGELPRLRSVKDLERAIAPHGRPRLVHFWALWCTACIEELPRQVAWARELRAGGVDVVFIDADGFDKAAPVRAHLVNLGALGVAEAAMLDMNLDVQEVTPLLARGWGGVLPATFARAANGAAVAQVIGPASQEDLSRLGRALSVKPPVSSTQGESP